MGFKSGPSAASRGRQKIIDLGTTTQLTMSAHHTNTIFLCGGATLGVSLPSASALPNGWNAKFICNDETAAVTITGVSDEMIGHVVTGGDNQNRQLQPTTAILFDKIVFTADVLKGDWVDITCLNSGSYHVRGDCRITDKITCTSP